MSMTLMALDLPIWKWTVSKKSWAVFFIFVCIIFRIFEYSFHDRFSFVSKSSSTINKLANGHFSQCDTIIDFRFDQNPFKWIRACLISSIQTFQSNVQEKCQFACFVSTKPIISTDPRPIKKKMWKIQTKAKSGEKFSIFKFENHIII